MIPCEQISVVVQGPIFGRPSDEPEVRLTTQSLRSARNLLPGAEIVLSTWENNNLDGLDFDAVVESKDPGAGSFSGRGSKAIYNNVNRQIVSTQAGLQAATRPFVVRLRSDSVLESLGFLEYFGKYKYRNSHWNILTERVVSCTTFSRDPRSGWRLPFHPGDWFYFGARTDLLNLWTIPLAPEPETSQWFGMRPHPDNEHVHARNKWAMRFTPEQYIWLSFLRKYGRVDCDHYCDCSPRNIWLTELTIVNNMVLAEPERLGVRSLKYDPDTYRYCPSLYSHHEWLSMYSNYCQRGMSTAREHRWKYWILDILEEADQMSWRSQIPLAWRVARWMRKLQDLIKMRNDWQRPTVQM